MSASVPTILEEGTDYKWLAESGKIVIYKAAGTNIQGSETYRIAFTYSGTSVTKSITISDKELTLEVVGGKYSNMELKTYPSVKWKVMYDGTEVTDRIATAIYIKDSDGTELSNTAYPYLWDGNGDSGTSLSFLYGAQNIPSCLIM